MPKSVDDFLRKLTATGMPKSEAIAIGKKQNKIVQQGKHLGAGPTMGTHKAKTDTKKGK